MPRVIFTSNYFKSHAHVLRHLEYLAKQSPLMNGTKEIALEDALRQVRDFPATTKWRFVFSLQAEDAERLAVDRSYWQKLIDVHRDEWAKAYHIPPERLHLYASFHNVAHHPHLHVVLHGETPTDGYTVVNKGQDLGDAFKKGRETVKSGITNEIFRGDAEALKKTKAGQRQELNKRIDQLLLKIGHNSHPIPAQLIADLKLLGQTLQKASGKKQYGYLSSELKEQVDHILEEIIATDPEVTQIYQLYRQSHSDLVEYLYIDSPHTMQEKMDIWEQQFFHPQKGQDTRRHNLIIKAAMEIHLPAAASTVQPAALQDETSLDPTDTSEITDSIFDTIYYQDNLAEYSRSRNLTTPIYHHKTACSVARTMLYAIGTAIRLDMQQQPFRNQETNHQKSGLQQHRKLHRQTLAEKHGYEVEH